MVAIEDLVPVDGVAPPSQSACDVEYASCEYWFVQGTWNAVRSTTACIGARFYHRAIAVLDGGEVDTKQIATLGCSALCCSALKQPLTAERPLIAAAIVGRLVGDSRVIGTVGQG